MILYFGKIRQSLFIAEDYNIPIYNLYHVKIKESIFNVLKNHVRVKFINDTEEE